MHAVAHEAFTQKSVEDWLVKTACLHKRSPLLKANPHAILFLNVAGIRTYETMFWTTVEACLSEGVATMVGVDSFMTGDTKHTSPYTETQEKNAYNRHASCEDGSYDGESFEMAKELNEGDRLDQVLAGHGMNRNRLAEISGVGTTTLQGWKNALKNGTITDKVWGKLARALQSAGIDPKEVRPSAAVPGKTKSEEVMPALLDIIQRKDKTMLNLALELLTVEDQGSRLLLVSLVRSAIDKL